MICTGPLACSPVMTCPDNTPTPTPTQAESVKGNPRGESHDRKARTSTSPHLEGEKNPSRVHPEALLTFASAAKLFSVSERTIRRLKKYGLKPVLMVGCRPRYHFKDILAAFRAKTVAEQTK